MRIKRMVLVGMALTLAACSGDDGLRQLSKPGSGPDEFRILPAKPLEQPTNLTALPVPTPGGVNRTDVDPISDAVVALGGSRSAATSTAISSSDAAMVNYTGRKGRSADIRAATAAEDADFRRKRGRFANIKLGKQDRYNEVYEQQHLGQFSEQDRWRQAGAPTPAAPPLNP
ncbi:DUF3035 domain-containing protein [Shimia sp. SDUM112013]|uniref:DUF3035 domain-containing protein n=1 Tax=Shimia sp. SDUM112013 TaxID=3136160 RepID=UPI0032EE579C